MKPAVKGVYTALVTPFLEDGKFDEKGFKKNIQFQIKNGVDGLVPLGTTGESPSLTPTEKEQIIKIAVKEAKGNIPVMVGTGTYSTDSTIANTLMAQKLGADYALIVSPYYNRPPQQGIYLHFKAVADATTIPIMIYNIQGRTGQNIYTDTLKRLAQIPNIIGVKEASGNIGQVSDVIENLSKIRTDFSIMSGDDASILNIMALGGHGVISVVSNLLPKQIKSLYDALAKEDYTSAREIHYQLSPFFRTAFIETNPIPIKAAMEHAGMASGKCRLPLCELLPENAEKLQASISKIFNLNKRK